jgi:hypothetical protein
VGMISMSLSAGRRGKQHVNGHRTMPAPLSAELQIGTKRWRGFNLVCRGWRGDNGREGFLIGGDGEVVNEWIRSRGLSDGGGVGCRREVGCCRLVLRLGVLCWNF